jgi:hypothetical protein
VEASNTSIGEFMEIVDIVGGLRVEGLVSFTSDMIINLSSLILPNRVECLKIIASLSREKIKILMIVFLTKL